MNERHALFSMRAGQGFINIHGHRGASGFLPENSLKGFRLAFEHGIRFVELDVHVTKDDVAVLTHNPRLETYGTRDADGKWLEQAGPLIAETTLRELQTYDVGGVRPDTDYAVRHPDQMILTKTPIPALEDLCRQMSRDGHTDCFLNIEIKSDPRHGENTPSLPKLIESTLRPLVKYNLENQVVIQSFDWRVLHECRRQTVAIPLSYLSQRPQPEQGIEGTIYEGSPWMAGVCLTEHNGNLPAAIAQDGGNIWTPFRSDLDAASLAEARAQDLVVNVWTVNDQDDIDRMIDLGVDGVITDYPGRIQQRLVKHGLHWLP